MAIKYLKKKSATMLNRTKVITSVKFSWDYQN